MFDVFFPQHSIFLYMLCIFSMLALFLHILALFYAWKSISIAVVIMLSCMMLTYFVCSDFVSVLHFFVACRCAAYTCCTFFAVEGVSVVHTSAGVLCIHVLVVCRGYVVLALAHCVAEILCTIIGIHILAFRLLMYTGLALALTCILLCIFTLHVHRTCMFDIHFWYTFQLCICAIKNKILLLYNHPVSFLFPYVYIHSLSSLFCFCSCRWWLHQLHRTSCCTPAALGWLSCCCHHLVFISSFHLWYVTHHIIIIYHHAIISYHHISFLWYFIICSITSSFHLLIFQSVLHHYWLSLSSSYSYSSSSSYQSSSYFIYLHQHHHNIFEYCD